MQENEFATEFVENFNMAVLDKDCLLYTSRCV